MAIDMEQFHQVFFEESLEGLDIMEQSLLALSEGDSSDSELINTIFRAAHSIKGGSGTFGFSEVADFTHVLETLLDEARDGQRVLTEECIELLLRSSDCLREMIACLQEKRSPDPQQANELVTAFNRVLSADEPEAVAKAEPAVEAAPTPTTVGGDDVLEADINSLLSGGDSNDAAPAPANHWKIQFTPESQILLTGNEPLRIFRELATLGELSVTADSSRIPEFTHLTTDECFISWTLELVGNASKDDILEAFEWVIDECTLDIRLLGDTDIPSTKEATPEPSSPAPEQPAQVTAVAEEKPQEAAPEPPATPVAATPEAKKADDKSPPAKTTATATTSTTSSIRVDIDKVDNLINLIGELVITQSMLSELGNNFDIDKLEGLTSGLEQLLQNTKELQESVMRIRMLPISFAFNRFPRMIRDLSIKTGKKVDLQVNGENTELDKTVMEQISDPLVHLVRNAIDHGIETAEERTKKGKPEQGTIHLDAYHQGGSIVIEIGDDGKGLNTEVLRQKAIEKGLITTEEQLTKQDIYDLIFLPGFSTAKEVSDISGRGVGMDVVKRNITSLGGRIVIDSQIDVGTTIKVFLPLTLAILDGQLVRVGSEVYIIPLVAIVESLQVKPELVNRVSGNMILYRLREDNIPIIPIYKEFGIQADNTDINNSLLVVVEGDGQKVGLMVDDLLAQQQVVIKSLENNYKRIEGISGATILGNGSVSMILDITGLITRASGRSRRKSPKKAA